MASGVTVTEEALEAFKSIKLPKNDDDRIRFLSFGFCNDKIAVEKTVTQKELNGENPFIYFKREFLQKKKCCYVLYDCHFETKDGAKKELVFVMWCPDDGKCKDKMNYASSKGALTKHLDGVKHRVDMHDCSDCSDVTSFAEKLLADVTAIEGCAVIPCS